MLTAALLFMACAAYWWWQQMNVKPTEPPNLPGGWPLVGHILRFITDRCTLWSKLNEVNQEISQLGGVVRANLGPRTVYVLTDPEDSLTVAASCMEKDPFYGFSRPWLGHGLVTAKYVIWKKHRKLLSPAFNQVVLDTFMGVFNSQSRKLVKDFEKEAGKGPFDHSTYIRHNALETICMTAMGIDYTNSNLNSKYVEALELIFQTMTERFQKFWWHSSKTFAWSKLKKKQDAVLTILHNMSNTVLQKRKSQFQQNINAGRSAIPGTKFKPFMDLLLELSFENQGVFTDKEIRDHVDTILVAGHDTTANVLIFTMVLLGSYPEVQQKVITEIQEVLGKNRDVEKTDLSKLVYLDAVLKESMRVFTIVPVIARKLDKDIKLKNCTLSANMTCVLLLFGIHKHPVWGQDVHMFKPERWLASDFDAKAFAAFGLGKRNCIGKNYAIMAMKTTVAHVVRSYRIKADHTKLRVRPDVMLKPESGHYISIERRV